MSTASLKELKSKFKYCASVAFYSAKLFNSHKFKVQEDKSLICNLFKERNEEFLAVYETLYKDILKNDRDCEKDIFSLHESEELSDHSNEEDNFTLAECIDGVRANKNAKISRGQKLYYQKIKNPS